MFDSDSKINRRGFFKELSLLVAAGAVTTPWLQSCSKEDEQIEVSKQRLRLAIIGTGSRGMYHINHLKQMPNVEVVALCDNYEPNLLAASKEFPKATLVRNYKGVLEMKEVEAVMIVTPLYLHSSMAIDALQAGKHVFCEKSMGMTPKECFDLYQAYRSSNRVLFIGQQRLYDKKYIKAMDMIHNGLIGDITGLRTYWFRNNNWRRPVDSPELEKHVNWRLYKALSGGLMTELAAHQLQVGNWALKMIPETVVGFGDITYWKDGREVYDNVSLVYRYDNGVKMTYESNIANKFNGLEEEILGNKGSMELEKGKYYFEEAAPAPGIMQLINDAEHKLLDNAAFAGPSWVPETASINKGYDIVENAVVVSGASSVGAAGDGSLELLQAFCDASITNKPVQSLVEEAYYSSVLALLGIEAMDTQSVVRFPEEYKIPYLNFV